MDDDNSPSGSRRPPTNGRQSEAPGRGRLGSGGLIRLGVLAGVLAAFPAAAEPPSAVPWTAVLSPATLIVALVLVAVSAFFSGSETAFFSIQRPRLRAMRADTSLTARLVVRLLDSPGHFLTTILVGNMLVNTLIGVILGGRIHHLFESSFGLSSAGAYVAAVAGCTALLVLLGEIAPKVFAMRTGETFARRVAVPLLVVDRLLAPVCRALLQFTDALFRVTRFYELRAAPYITDEELKAVLYNGEAGDVAEKEGRQMIRRILEFHDVMVREVLVPRPDVVALSEEATVAEARDLFREKEFSRIPVYKDNLDHIQGVLFAKDLLPSVSKGNLTLPIRSLVRRAHYVPETMSVQDFVNETQRLRTHLAIVVDEYGGTEGIVTLEDAIEQVVGDILDEHEGEDRGYEKVAAGVYRIQGNFPLDELTELTDIVIEDEEHETVAGFLMDKSEKILEAGDRIRHGGALFVIEAVDGKRVDTVRVEIPCAPGGEVPAP